jgi:hypothetical protein
MRLPIALLTLLSSPPAQAFCGTYVGGAGTNIYNNLAEVAIVRRGSQTVLSISNDVEGDTEDFALVVPVPEVLPREAINVIDRTLFQRLGSYSEPRMVRYTCSDFEEADADTDADADGDSDADADADTDVDVEAEYIVGEYEVVILSATESSALYTWLGDNGYAVPESTEALLQSYLDAGSYFFAAKVGEDAEITSGSMLSPLQFGYDSAVFSLPIRLGTANSPGAQDLIIYGVNSFTEGRLGIANYDEFAVEDECLFDPYGEQTLTEFYDERFTEGYERTGEGAWAVEYAWGASGCDPCTGEPPDLQDLITLGYDPYETGTPTPSVRDVFFTRLHMRYTPGQADEDLVLYLSGLTEQQQVRYIEYAPFLEDRWPVCVTGWVDDPGSCDDDGSGGSDGGGAGGGSGDGGARDWNESDDPAELDDDKGSGCAVAAGAPGLAGLGLAALLGLTRRRER